MNLSFLSEKKESKQYSKLIFVHFSLLRMNITRSVFKADTFTEICNQMKLVSPFFTQTFSDFFKYKFRLLIELHDTLFKELFFLPYDVS